jgi:hypothetical protein
MAENNCISDILEEEEEEQEQGTQKYKNKLK